MRITPEVIEKVNSLCPTGWDDDSQGIWREAYGVPNNEKRLCLVMRWSPGGATGGSCWEDSDLQDYTNDQPSFVVLDKLLEVVNLQITDIKYNEILGHMREYDETSNDYDYYGNHTDWQISYIPLEDVMQVIGLKALLERL